MSKSAEIATKPENIVRLKIDGAKTAVNTLRDQQTGRGVSLVCPFPALEVDIPVSFGSNKVMTMGAIHRIGVEDDPETGLPRLRLSIRNRETGEILDTTTAQTLIAQYNEEMGKGTTLESDTKKEIPAPRRYFSESDFDVKVPTSTSKKSEGALFSEFADEEDRKEPNWVDCRDVPMPEEFHERVRTRRRYKMFKHVVLASLLGMAVGAVYTLQRAGIVDLNAVADRVMALSFGSDVEQDLNQENLIALAAKSEEKAPVKESPATPEVPVFTEEIAAPTPTLQEASYAPTALDYADSPNPVTPELPLVENNAPVETAAVPQENAKEEQETGPSAETDITLTLPTRWPVEYATAYRMRDPNGVVVDVPGGLVKREGWLPESKNYEMIRSIKSIQRESGARFVIYVNGDLPRYMTTPKPVGVALRLFHEKDVEKAATVASR